jgi:hypothetical protein
MIVFLPTLLLAEEAAVKITKPSCATYREMVDVHSSSLKHIKKPDWVDVQYTKITITPQKFTSPLLKYRINVFPTEKEFGNAHPLYMEALAEYKKVYNARMEDCLKSKEYHNLAPTKDTKKIEQLKFSYFPIYKMGGNWDYDIYVTADVEADLYRSLESAYEILEKASRRSYYLPESYEFNGIFTKLSHLNDAGTLSKFLRSKANWEIRNGKLDNAIKTIKTGLALSDHIFNMRLQNFSVNFFVAINIERIMKEELLLLVSQPDAPNLYPALTQLPSRQDAPLTAIYSEQITLFNLNRQTINMETYDKLDELSPDECKNVVEQVAHSFYYFNRSDIEIDEKDTSIAEEKQNRSRRIAAICAFSYVNAKERLLRRGVSIEKIESLTVYQVVAPYFLEEIKRVYDLIFVNTTLKRGEPHYDFFGGDKEQELLDFTNPVSILLDLCVKSLDANTLFRRLNMLSSSSLKENQDWDKIKIVEAIRYYAAIHNKLPESLDDIKEVPVPKNSPMTGNPYRYHVEGNSAFLDYAGRASRPNSLNSRLEIILDKRSKK